MENTKTTTKNNLTIVKGGKQLLTKNQEEFNKLTTRIEKLQKEIVNKKLRYDQAIEFYAKNNCLVKSKMLDTQKELIVSMWQNFSTYKLAPKDQQIFKQMIRELLQNYFMGLTTPPEDDIKNIFATLEGMEYDKVYKSAKKKAFKELLKELKDRKVDITDVDKTDYDALAAKLREHFINLRQEVVEEQEERTAQKKIKQKPKSAKQIVAENLAEEMAAAKQKNIGTIYKQLAKLFHPDLEQDEERKQEKVLLMQELTAAYEAKNLHALLTLELRWIHKENDHLETLSEEKLHVYLQILKEQIADLTEEKSNTFFLPQYGVLREEFGWAANQKPMETVRDDFRELLDYAVLMINDTRELQTPTALKHAKKMIKEWKTEKKQQQEFDQIFEDISEDY